MARLLSSSPRERSTKSPKKAQAVYVSAVCRGVMRVESKLRPWPGSLARKVVPMVTTARVR